MIPRVASPPLEPDAPVTLERQRDGILSELARLDLQLLNGSTPDVIAVELRARRSTLCAVVETITSAIERRDSSRIGTAASAQSRRSAALMKAEQHYNEFHRRRAQRRGNATDTQTIKQIAEASGMSEAGMRKSLRMWTDHLTNRVPSDAEYTPGRETVVMQRGN